MSTNLDILDSIRIPLLSPRAVFLKDQYYKIRNLKYHVTTNIFI